MTYFRSLGQNFVCFLVQMRRRKFAFEIYWPLEECQDDFLNTPMCVRKCTFSFLTNFAVHISPYYTECIWCFVGYLDIPTLIHPVIISSLFLHKTGSQWVELLSTGGAFLFSRVSNLSCYRSMYIGMFHKVWYCYFKNVLNPFCRAW